MKIAAILAEGHGSTAGPVVYISGEEVSCWYNWFDSSAYWEKSYPEHTLETPSSFSLEFQQIGHVFHYSIIVLL